MSRNTDSTKSSRLVANVEDTEKERVKETAAEMGIGEGALIRLILRRVWQIGDGDPLAGIGKLQLAAEHGLLFHQQGNEGMYFVDEANAASHPNDPGDEDDPLAAFRTE